MKITFVTMAPALDGGYRSVATYAGRLRDRGHEVHVVARLAAAPSARHIFRSLRLGRGWPRRFRPDTTYLDRVRIAPRYVEPPRPVTDADVPDADVVIATWWETAEWVERLSPSKGSKVYLIQDHEVFPYLPVERVEATWRMPLHKIVVSQWLADVARTTYGDGDASLVPYGVDHQLFRAPPRGKNPVPTVGLVYTSIPRKTCELALEAFHLAARRLPGLRLIAFSTHDEVSWLRLPPGAELHVRRPQARLRELYAACDAWLFSSRTEGFGMPILEAMACRTPVIATPAGAAPELLAGGGGILVKPEDPDDMARAIERIITLGEPDWSRLSDLAFATASRHNWDEATDLFEEALRAAIRKPGPRPVGCPDRAGPGSHRLRPQDQEVASPNQEDRP
jgi:glycosyltransferase involved in cell wall biosynthesis